VIYAPFTWRHRRWHRLFSADVPGILGGMIRFFGLAVIALLLTAPAAMAEGGGKQKRLLFFTKASSHVHEIITMKDGQPSFAQKALEELGKKHGFLVTHSKDGGVFTPSGIAGYDAFVFYTSGDLTAPGNDKNPPMSPEGKASLLEAIARGKGFVGIHPAADTFNTPGDRFQPSGAAVDPYIKMLGGEILNHGMQQTARVLCADRKFPGFAECKDSFVLLDDFYSFRNFAKDLHVLLSLATWTMKNTGAESVYRRPPFPIAWARKHGKGRVFYTVLGHREEVWANPQFQNMLVGGLRWATGQASAAVKPNIATVTPGFDEMPPQDPPPAQAAARPAAPAAASAQR
jgi:type 1 glutamine amidotransferase